MDLTQFFKDLVSSLQVEIVIVFILFLFAKWRENRTSNYIQRMKEYREILETIDPMSSREDVSDIKKIIDNELALDAEIHLAEIKKNIETFTRTETPFDPSNCRHRLNLIALRYASIIVPVVIVSVLTAIAFIPTALDAAIEQLFGIKLESKLIDVMTYIPFMVIVYLIIHKYIFTDTSFLKIKIMMYQAKRESLRRKNSGG